MSSELQIMSRSVYINDIQVKLPHEPVSNDEMETRLGLIGNKPSKSRRIVLRSNGIKFRHYVIDPSTGEPSYTNAELTAEAVKQLQNKSFDLNQIECLVSGTTGADQIMPNHAVMVHGELGIPECEVVATSGICLSGLSALKYAFLSVASGDTNHSVATGSEISSNIMLARNFDAEHEDKVKQLEKRPEIAFEKDFLRWMLSDGAGAVRLSAEPNNDSLSLRVEWIDILSYAHELEACMYGGAEKDETGKLKGWTLFNSEERASKSVFALKQDVKLLDENIVKLTVEKALAAVAKKRGITPQDIDFFLPHYSSEYFREKLYNGLKNIDFEVPYEKWFTNLQQKGNTGSASIYIILEELFHSGKLKVGQRLLCYVPESGRFSSGFMLLEVV